MKCPKCGYLGFERGDRCRNCGYDFSLATSASDALDVVLDPGPEHLNPPLDLDRVIGAPEPEALGDLPLFGASQAEATQRAVAARRAAGLGIAAEDMPLISAPARPRAPLGVRRATGEVPRARPRTTRRPVAEDDTLFEPPPQEEIPVPAAVFAQALHPKAAAVTTGDLPASPVRRIAAALVDVALLSAVDSVVVYLTLRLLSLTTTELFALPFVPLAAFFLLLNGGYFVAFTTVGGQSIGKMALGIKVVGEGESSVSVGRAALRTLAYIASALPLGAGFLTGVISADRLALHDRLAHTRVVRPSSM
jgi:uncharacterized RDD family membrane protein YckC